MATMQQTAICIEGAKAQIAERLMRRVVKRSDGCWLWTGAQQPAGYGSFKLNGRIVSTHRLSMWLFKDTPLDTPRTMHADHLCRVPACVNPDHLELVTAAENRARGIRSSMPLRTHCNRGHLYDQANTRPIQGGRYRSCRICLRMKRNELRASRRNKEMN